MRLAVVVRSPQRFRPQGEQRDCDPRRRLASARPEVLGGTTVGQTRKPQWQEEEQAAASVGGGVPAGSVCASFCSFVKRMNGTQGMGQRLALAVSVKREDKIFFFCPILIL